MKSTKEAKVAYSTKIKKYFSAKDHVRFTSDLTEAGLYDIDDSDEDILTRYFSWWGPEVEIYKVKVTVELE